MSNYISLNPHIKNIPPYRWKRRITQFAMLLLIILVPASGMFHIDLPTASFFIFDFQIPWYNFTLVVGLALIFVTGPIFTYMTVGSVWCGWACPQSLVSELSDKLTFKILGKRASVRVEDLERHDSIVAASKNKLLNWVFLGAIYIFLAIVIALIPFLLFFSPAYLWGMLIHLDTDKQSTFIFYLMIVFLVFADLAFIRYYLCDYACFYRIGQKMFGKSERLHVAYDATRSSDCTRCNYCATVCITNIEPTHIKPEDSCINCGECIDACDRLHHKSNTGDTSSTSGLFTFQLTSTSSNTSTLRKIGKVLAKSNKLVAALLCAGVALTIIGIATQPPPIAKIPLEVRLKAQQIAGICNAQCTQQLSACNSRNVEGCFRAEACRCECSLQHDPSNASSEQWKQCVQRNLSFAELSKKNPALWSNKALPPR